MHAPEGAPSGSPDGVSPQNPTERAYEPVVHRDALAEVDEAQTKTGHAVRARESRRLEIASAAVAVVATAALIRLARQIEVRRQTDGIDPQWWPELLGIVGLALAVVLFFVAVVRAPASRDDLEAATKQGWARVVAAVALAVAYILLWPILGFLPVTGVFLAAVTALFGGRGWRTVLLFPVLLTGFIYLLFHTLLKVPL